jgi:hypothetical protein
MVWTMQAMMGSRRGWALGALLLASVGCSGDGGEPGQEETGTDTGGVEPSSTAGSTEADASTTASVDESSGSDTSSESGELACELHPETRIELTVQTIGMPFPPPAGLDTCLGTGVSTQDGVLFGDGSTIEHYGCASCDCVPDGFPDTVFELGTSLTAPTFEGCGRISAWAAVNPEGDECVWTGFAVLPTRAGGETAPLYIATNGREVDAYGVPPFAMGLDPLAPCEDASTCAQVPGRYVLTVGSEQVEVGTPEVLALPAFGGLEYEVTSLMSSVDLECAEHVSWTAERMGA